MIGKLEKKENKGIIKKSIQYLKNRGFEEIKADVDGYSSPNSFFQKAGDLNLTPDITALKDGKKYYFDIGLKSEKTRMLKSKWLLLDQIANLTSKRFKIITVKGHIKFTKDLLKELDLNYKKPIRIAVN